MKPSAEQEGQPFLYVRVTTIRIADEMLFAYTVQVELRQHVRIERESPFIKGGHARVASATTGSDGAMGYAGRGVFARSVTGRIEEFIDNFALAYLKSKDIERAEGPGEPKAQEPKGSTKSMHQSVQL
ncbi:hypothetical protein F0U60_54080 [Archangium minus]|uniref:Lipoprotein n=1 Tax=Archangium minus TaxID=83450 RepID=A0ABY9X9I6_9BACT|nr:hypothetical protein F0U60_54080 [Archangium minus]